MPTTRDIKNAMKLIQGGAKAEAKVLEAGATFTGRAAIEKGVIQAQTHLPVRVRHPFNPKEVFQFPPGTGEQQAKEMVRAIVLKRAREGTEEIDLPSKPPKSVIDEISRLEKEINRIAETEADLATRNLEKMAPQLYLDEATGKYWKVNKQGHIEELTTGIDEGFEKWASELEDRMRHQEFGEALEASGPVTRSESLNRTITEMRDEGMTYDQATKMLTEIYKDYE